MSCFAVGLCYNNQPVYQAGGLGGRELGGAGLGGAGLGEALGRALSSDFRAFFRSSSSMRRCSLPVSCLSGESLRAARARQCSSGPKGEAHKGRRDAMAAQLCPTNERARARATPAPEAPRKPPDLSHNALHSPRSWPRGPRAVAPVLGRAVAPVLGRAAAPALRRLAALLLRTPLPPRRPPRLHLVRPPLVPPAWHATSLVGRLPRAAETRALRCCSCCGRTSARPCPARAGRRPWTCAPPPPAAGPLPPSGACSPRARTPHAAAPPARAAVTAASRAPPAA
jgi:hypothetical protein